MTSPPLALLPPLPSALQARDPDTPVAVLKGLIEGHVDDFLMNPLAPLLPVLDGSFFSSLPFHSEMALLRSPRLPDYVLRELLRVKDLPQAYSQDLLIHPRLPPECLFGLVARWHPNFSVGLLGGELLAALLRHGVNVLGPLDKEQPPCLDQFTELNAHGASVVAGLLPSFSAHQAPAFRCYAAAHSLCPPELLEQLAKDVKPSVRAAVATNPSAPPELRLRMAQSQDAPVLAAMARDPESPPEIFEMLSLSSRVLPRMLVAEQPRAPESALKVLSGDASPLVRQALSWNVAAREFFV